MKTQKYFFPKDLPSQEAKIWDATKMVIKEALIKEGVAEQDITKIAEKIVANILAYITDSDDFYEDEDLMLDAIWDTVWPAAEEDLRDALADILQEDEVEEAMQAHLWKITNTFLNTSAVTSAVNFISME